jgi:hypothetical protein
MISSQGVVRISRLSQSAEEMVKSAHGEFRSISNQMLRDRLDCGSIRPVDRLDRFTSALRARVPAHRKGPAENLRPVETSECLYYAKTMDREEVIATLRAHEA